MTLHHVDFEPVGLRGQSPDDRSLMDAARQLGVDVVSVCGDRGICGRCKVQLLAGTLSEPTTAEKERLSSLELEQGYRLACQARPMSDCKVRVPPETLGARQRTQVEGLEVSAAPEPPVDAYRVRMSPPSWSDLRADCDRLMGALREQCEAHCDDVDIEVLRTASPRIRGWEWEVRASARDGEIVALGPWTSRQLGLAVDLGTTKIAGYLVDLDTGHTLAARGIMNPQIAYGEDLIARLARAMESPSEAQRLQALVVQALNGMAADLGAEVDAGPEEIVEAVVVGNTAMHHLFLRLPVQQLAVSPYVPAVSAALDVKARDVGLTISPGAYVHLLPNIGGFVGSDHVAMLLGTDAWRAEDLLLAMDIGTNTEVALVSGDEIASVSCASGPAFEGAHIKHGMRAAPGAIEVVQLVGEQLEYSTIGGVSPVGICGSGILDAVAGLYLAGVIDASGRMGEHDRIRDSKGGREFLLVPQEEVGGECAITVTQRDVREIQLAKGAMRTGIELLLQSKGRAAEEIGRVIIAGAFGTYIDVASAIAIGMLPALPLHRFVQVGNAAGTGARLALISRTKREEAQSIARRTEYIELNNFPSFQETFAESMYLGQS
jgi:uncharacterized 2Fe-2S/4Fe-4S cluster protein (DUF4445 family)